MHVRGSARVRMRHTHTLFLVTLPCLAVGTRNGLSINRRAVGEVLVCLCDPSIRSPALCLFCRHPRQGLGLIHEALSSNP